MPTYSHPSVPLVVSTDQQEGAFTPELSQGVTASVEIAIGDPAAGLAVFVEQTGTGVIYTVPAGKTFTGYITVIASASGAGVIKVADASSVVQQIWAPSAAVPAEGPQSAQVSIAGGGGGNALTVTESGAASIISVSIQGYVK